MKINIFSLGWDKNLVSSLKIIINQALIRIKILSYSDNHKCIKFVTLTLGPTKTSCFDGQNEGKNSGFDCESFRSRWVEPIGTEKTFRPRV